MLPDVKFLIVDDIAENLIALEALLRRDGLEVFKAQSGNAALELVLEHEFALALVDVQMPGMDGFELAELMRGAERSKRIPIIFVTAGSNDTQRVFKGYEAGAVDFLFKPIDPHILQHKASIFFDLYRQKQQLAEQLRLLHESEVFRLAILQSSADYIKVLDRDTRIVWMNERAQQFLGSTVANLADKSWLEYWDVESERTAAEIAVTTARAGGIGRFEGWVPALDGKPRCLEVALSPLATEAASDAGDRLLCVSRDITERKSAEKERERLMVELERSNRELEQFAYVAAHDLKTPLRGIASVTQWLGDDLGSEVNEDAQKQMALLLNRVRRMEALIDGILSYSRAGKTKEVPERVDVARLLSEIISLIAPAPEVNIVIGEMPVLTTARVPLQQLFLNLINNAIKHSGRPDVTIHIRAEDHERSCEFVVADNGKGIPPQYHQKIWGLFQTLESKDKVEGTGIGLSVVKKVVETRGGRVWLDPEPECGAVFHFIWPKA